MTTYSLSIGATDDVQFIDISFEKKGGSNPDDWKATLPASDTTVLTSGMEVVIYRDGTAIYGGILEIINKTMSSDGSIKAIGGRGKSVLLWRRWIERYVDTLGFWSAYYPSKIIEFLLHPSRSEYDPDESVTRIGYGLNPVNWVITSSYPSATNCGTEYMKDRLSLFGFRSGRNQTNGDYITIDLGTTKSLVGIRIENWEGNYEWNFLRNYKIEVSTNGSSWTEVASKDHNKALNVVESWDPTTDTRYVKITCTANWNCGWAITDVFLYENDVPITGITKGTINEFLPLNVSLCTSNVSAGATTIEVEDGWKFNEGDYIVIGDDIGDEGVRSYVSPVTHTTVGSVTGDTITLQAGQTVTNNYTTANNAYVLNYSGYVPIDLDYQRRTDAIDAIVAKMLEDDIPWIWEVDIDGHVNVGKRTGSDKSATISFERGVNIITASNNNDARQKIDRVLVIGRGKGDEQDRTGSGWVGTGDYEFVDIDSSASSPETSLAKAQTLIAQNTTSHLSYIVVVRDTYDTNEWTLDDDITITDTISGMSGSYRIKGVSRTYNSKAGEIVKIELTTKTDPGLKMISDMINAIRQSNMGDRNRDFPGIYDNPSYIMSFETEYLSDGGSRTIIENATSSNKKHIKMASTSSGAIFAGPGATLKPGNYKAFFISKVTDKTSTDAMLTIDVYSETSGVSSLGFVTVTPSLYTTNDTWQAITIPFQMDVEYTDISFRAYNFTSGITDWFCDYVGLQTSSDYVLDYPVGAPAAPTGFNAAGGVSGITLTWNANTEADMEHYNLYKNTSSSETGATEIARVSGTGYYWQCPVADLGDTFYFWVKAVDRANNISLRSNVDSDHADEPTYSISPGSIDGDLLSIEQRKWVSNIGFSYDETTPDWAHIYWGLGTDTSDPGEVAFSNGDMVGVNPGDADNLMDGIYWVYWDEDHMSGGNFDLQITPSGSLGDYDECVGPGKGVVGTIQVLTTGDEAGPPTMIPTDSYLPSFSAGVINAGSIFSRHISNTDWIESKKFRTGGGFVMETETGTAGVGFDSTGIRGKDATGKTAFFLDSATGKMSIRGAEPFLIYDTNGLITGYFGSNSSSSLLNLRASGGKTLSLVALTTLGSIHEISIDPNSAITINDTMVPKFDTHPSDVSIGTNAKPFTSVHTDLLALVKHVPAINPKPSAGSDYDGHFAYERSSGGKGKLFICMQNDASDYEWVQVAITT